MLTDTDRRLAAESFTNFWNSKPFTPAGFESESPNLARLHEDKIDARIRPILEELGKRAKSDGFITMSKEIADAYMFHLTESVSRARHLPKLSDDADMFTIMQYFVHDAQINEFVMDREAPEFAAALALNVLIPEGIEHKDMKVLIEFRQRNTEARAAFRASVRGVLDELAQVSDESYARQVLSDFQEKLRKMHESWVQALMHSAMNPETVLLSVGLPAAGSILSALVGGDPFSVAATTVDVLFIAIAALNEAVKSRRSNWSSSEASYLINLERQFGQAGTTLERPGNFSRLMEEFIND